MNRELNLVVGQTNKESIKAVRRRSAEQYTVRMMNEIG